MKGSRTTQQMLRTTGTYALKQSVHKPPLVLMIVMVLAVTGAFLLGDGIGFKGAELDFIPTLVGILLPFVLVQSALSLGNKSNYDPKPWVMLVGFLAMVCLPLAFVVAEGLGSFTDQMQGVVLMAIYLVHVTFLFFVREGAEDVINFEHNSMVHSGRIMAQSVYGIVGTFFMCMMFLEWMFFSALM